MNKPKLIIIGNAKPEKNYSELIKPEDYVIRFNKIQHFRGGMVGDRTDLIVLVTNHSLRMHCYRGRLHKDVMRHYKTAKSVWYRLSSGQSLGYKSYMRQIERRLGLAGVQNEILSNEDCLSLVSDFNYKMPSTGFVVLNKIIKESLFEEYDKYLCCLEGSYVRRHHNMALERKQIKKWVDEGVYNIL